MDTLSIYSNRYEIFGVFWNILEISVIIAMCLTVSFQHCPDFLKNIGEFWDSWERKSFFFSLF